MIGDNVNSEQQEPPEMESSAETSFRRGYMSFSFTSPKPSRRSSIRIHGSTGELLFRKLFRRPSQITYRGMRSAKDQVSSWYDSLQSIYDFTPSRRDVVSGHDHSSVLGARLSSRISADYEIDDNEVVEEPDFDALTEILAVDDRATMTTSQFIFNSINIFIGVGLLSLPYMFKMGGWIIGTFLILSAAWFSRYMIRILIKAMIANNSNSYSDIGEKLFGTKGKFLVTALLFGELFFCSCSYVILVGDTLYTILETRYAGEWFCNVFTLKLIAFLGIMMPTTLITSFRVLSIGSVVGIMTSLLLGFVILYDGFSLKSSPGSIIYPAETKLFPVTVAEWLFTPLSLGMTMYNYSGAAVIPNMYRNLKKPETFNKALNITIAFVTLWFLSFCGVCYTMFGNDTLEEVTFNIAKVEGYNKVMNTVLLWLIVCNPLTKFALILNPVCQSLESIFIAPWFQEEDNEILDPLIKRRASTLTYSSGESLESFPDLSSRLKLQSPYIYCALTCLLRISIATLAFLVGAYYPNFNGLLSIIGSFFSFSVSAAFPIIAYMKTLGAAIYPWEKVLLILLLAFSILMMVVGSVWPLVLHLLIR
ncbi:hypothetical protein MP638_003648 [Amoeboaphelidium occidentale]|nr:hypothetical protein MP638_003648 [Amoeboaphelidium occidentale]